MWCDVKVEEGKKSCSVKRTARESSLRCAAEIKKGEKAEEKAEKKGWAWRDWRWGFLAKLKLVTLSLRSRFGFHGDLSSHGIEMGLC